PAPRYARHAHRARPAGGRRSRVRRRGDAGQGPRGPEGDELVPDVSPFTNALAWSFAIIFGCWAATQLIEVVTSLREQGPQAPPAAEPALEEPARAAHDARH